jgi:hypothetical protein
VAQTSLRDVCDMLIPLEAEVESLHPSAAHFYGLNHLHYLTTTMPEGRVAPASSTGSGLSASSLARPRPARRAGLPHPRIRSHPAERDCHLLLWPPDAGNPTQIMQRLEERTAKFIAPAS